MKFTEAQVADILQASQRDETFINDLQGYLTSAVKLLGPRHYNQLRKILPPITTSWYYLLTSLSNLQTLGEEYTGTLRLDGTNKIPTVTWQLLWLVLYVGGEALYDRILNQCEGKISTSKEVTEDAKKQIVKCLRFLKENKHLLQRLHHSIFYMNGKYYNLANRTTGIKYVLVRQWLENDTASRSFSILGKISLLYSLFKLIQNFLTQNTYNGAVNVNSVSDSSKMCTLCVENRKDTCATLCGHLFCWECIYDSLKYQQSCPICRDDINPSRIIYLQNYS